MNAFLLLSFQGGIYLFQLIDWYSSAFALLLGSALEGIVVCWIYGKYTVAPWVNPEWGTGDLDPLENNK